MDAQEAGGEKKTMIQIVKEALGAGKKKEDVEKSQQVKDSVMDEVRRKIDEECNKKEAEERKLQKAGNGK